MSPAGCEAEKEKFEFKTHFKILNNAKMLKAFSRHKTESKPVGIYGVLLCSVSSFSLNIFQIDGI